MSKRSSKPDEFLDRAVAKSRDQTICPACQHPNRAHSGDRCYQGGCACAPDAEATARRKRIHDRLAGSGLYPELR